MKKMNETHQPDNTPAPGHATASTALVAGYYDANTRRFLALGGSGDAAAIHRAIWAPGVDNRADAFRYLNRLVTDAVRPMLKGKAKEIHVLDLGCGIGGTSTWLARELGVQVTGITISTTQRELAEQRARSLGLNQQTRFIAGDFDELPTMASLPVAQAACAIESFAHVSDPHRFFAMAARQLEDGGRLIICDDFLSPARSPEAQRCRRRVIEGWHLHSLMESQEVLDIAAAAGFRLLELRDHSAHIHALNPLLLWLASTLTRLPLPGNYWENLSGGTALQICLRRGWTRYLSLVWERHGSIQSCGNASSSNTGQ